MFSNVDASIACSLNFLDPLFGTVFYKPATSDVTKGDDTPPRLVTPLTGCWFLAVTLFLSLSKHIDGSTNETPNFFLANSKHRANYDVLAVSDALGLMYPSYIFVFYPVLQIVVQEHQNQLSGRLHNKCRTQQI